MELHAPVDYERLPEFWQLCDALRNRLRSEPTSPQPSPQSGEGAARAIEQAATFIFWRLFVTLAYSAKRTNRPGWLTEPDERRMAESVEPLFGDNCPVVTVLSEGVTPLLVKAEGGHDCPLFRELNAHLAGNHVTPAERGNLRSRFSASLKQVAQAAMQQAVMFEPDEFKDREGNVIERRAVDKCMNLIMRIDRALAQNQPTRQRLKGEFTQGFVNDAYAVIQRRIPDEDPDPRTMTLRKFLYFILENTDAVPKSTEEILRDFDRLFEVAKKRAG